MVKRDTAHIQLCYALPEKAVVIDLDVEVGCTLEEIVGKSGLLAQFPEIDLSKNKLGIYGKLKPLDTVAREGDRIEIYRTLQADPMESRRRRAQHKTRSSKKKVPRPTKPALAKRKTSSGKSSRHIWPLGPHPE